MTTKKCNLWIPAWHAVIYNADTVETPCDSRPQDYNKQQRTRKLRPWLWNLRVFIMKDIEEVVDLDVEVLP